MKLGKFAIGAAIIGLGLAAPASAVVVIDRSVDIIGIRNRGASQNISDLQNFLVQFTLSSATTLQGAAVYSSLISQGGQVSVGNPVRIKIRNDVNGAPAATNLFVILTNLSFIDNVGSSTRPAIKRMAADFAPVDLAAGTYWFGMSGRGADIGWNGDNENSRPSTQRSAFLADNVVRSVTDQINMPYQLYGALANVNTIPEPSAWVMLVLGFGMLGTAVRRQQRGHAVALAT